MKRAKQRNPINFDFPMRWVLWSIDRRERAMRRNMTDNLIMSLAPKVPT